MCCCTIFILCLLKRLTQKFTIFFIIFLSVKQIYSTLISIECIIYIACTKQKRVIIHITHSTLVKNLKKYEKKINIYLTSKEISGLDWNMLYQRQKSLTIAHSNLHDWYGLSYLICSKWFLSKYLNCCGNCGLFLENFHTSKFLKFLNWGTLIWLPKLSMFERSEVCTAETKKNQTSKLKRVSTL